MRSFRRAITEGADALELDLRLTRDGNIVVLHDPTLGRTTDGLGPVREFTLASLRQFDAGLGERVPTFAEVIAGTHLPIHAEIKASEAAEPLAKAIREIGVAERVTPICFDLEALRRVKRILPDQKVGLICVDVSRKVIESASSTGVEFISVQASRLNSAKVEQIRQSGLKVITWTVNEPRLMRRLIKFPVDGIVTDRPDLLSSLTSSLST